MKTWAIIGIIGLLAPAGVPTGAFDLKPENGRVEFSVKDNRGGFTGQTQDVTGTVTVRQKEGGYAADVEAKVDARTIRTGASLRDGQMRGAQFLNTAQFPFITFSGAVTADSPSGTSFNGTLRGQLKVKNKTRDIEMPLDITVDGSAYTARGTVTVKFSDFDLPVPRFLFFVAENSITIKLQVRLTPRGSSS